ncbi:MAG: ribonuclease P protein component [Paenibacillus sp.]|nr:ribonuclease P protein component [Paenibacillus sp.]
MKGLRLYKIEKLCSETAICRLFARSDSSVRGSLSYPVRLAWRVDEGRDVKVPRFLVSVPKKRIRHAVDRVTMRRRIREAYRLNRGLLPRDLPVDLAFIYVADTLLPYAKVESSVRRLLRDVASKLGLPAQESARPTPAQD